jgi:hypothetical protein
MENIIDLFAKNFDPISTILILIVAYFVSREIRRLMRTVLLSKCKVQAIFETIDKHSANGQAAYMRDRYESLLKESQLKEN